MAKPEYIQLLSTSERAWAMKLGMTSVLASNRMLTKKANPVANFISGAHAGGKGVAALIAATSLIAGAPIGAVAHHMGQKIKGDRRDEKERLKRIDYYRNAAKQLETGLNR